MSSPRSVIGLACDACRERKYKCSMHRPSCSGCTQHNRVCHYSPKAVRSPLTRQYVTYLEARISQLECKLRDGESGSDPQPSKPSESSLDNSPQNNGNLEASLQESSISPPWLDVALERDDYSSNLPSESMPQQADGFDWVEEELPVCELSDGMAALSVRPEGASYLGPSSSVAFLRALLPFGWDADYPSQASGKNASTNNSQYSEISSPRNLLSSAPQLHLVTRLVDAYFLNYHTTYPFIHEPTFRAQFNELVPRPKGPAWSMLLNTVLGLGAWTIGDETSILDDTFFQNTVRISQDMSIFGTGSLSLVQSLLLLSNYAQKRNKPNTGWNFLGLAVRVALSLGLHREFPKWSISLLQREIRRRIWWGVFIFDSGASVTFGRPILLPTSTAMDVKMVLNILEGALTPATTEDLSESDSCTVYSGLIAQSRFHQAANSIFNRLISDPQLTAEGTLKLDEPIDDWFSRLPDFFPEDGREINDEFAFARSRIWWRSWNLQIILHRPILFQWALRKMTSRSDTRDESLAESACRHRCLQSAHATILSVHEYVSSRSYTRLGSWYWLYFLFQASLIPIIAIVADPLSLESSSWLDDIDRAKELLSQEIPNNSLARRCLEVIDRLTPNLSEEGAKGWGVAETDMFFNDLYSLAAQGGAGVFMNDSQLLGGNFQWDN